MADDLSLLFRIRGDAVGAKTATAETRAAVAQLKSALGSDFNSMQKASESALAGIGNKLNFFVGERIPLVGGAFVRVSENLRNLGGESKKGEAELAKFGKTIDGLSTSTGKSKSELINFLTSFVQLETQAKRDAAAIEFVGVATAQTLIPQLEKAGEELSTVATSTENAGAALAGIAGPIGIAVVALLAATAAAVLLAKEFFDLTVQTAEFQGKLFDLSQQTGVSVETLSALEIVAKTTGSSLEQITASLGIFQKNLEAAHDPTSKQAELLESLGISATNTEDALRQTLAALAQMPEGYRQTAAALELFGRGGKSVLAILKETNGDLDGAIKRFREMGILISTDAAKAADKFNDQLAILGFQMRAITALIVQDSIPRVLKILEEFSRILNDNREAIQLLGKAIGVVVEGNIKVLEGSLFVITGIVHDLELAWDGVRIAALLAAGKMIEAAAATATALQKAKDYQTIKPTTAEPSKTLPYSEGEYVAPGSGVPESIISISDLAKAKLAADEAARISKDRIAQAERDFKQGQITRDQESASIIAALKKENEARHAATDAEIADKQKLQGAREGNVAEQRKIQEEIEKLRQDQRTADSEYYRKVVDEESKALEARNKALIDHLDNQISLRLKANEIEIKAIQARVKSGEVLAQTGEDEIERIENEGLDARRNILTQELQLTGLDFEERNKLIQRRGELEQEATETKRQQAERRKQIAFDEVEFEKTQLLSQIDSQLRLGSIRDNAQIASLRALASMRIKNEEETEQAILAIRLAAIDREKLAIEARQTAAGLITDPKVRKAEQEKLNADLRVNQAERQTIEEQGERDTEAGRQRDIENRRRYVREIPNIDDQINASELDRRRRELELLAQRQGLNAHTIALFRQLTLDEETERHKRIVGEINAQEAEAHALDVGNKNKLEIEERYNQLREQENQRFHDRQGEINAPGGAGVSGRETSSAIEQLNTAITENLSGATLTAAQAGIEALTTAFQGLGQAVGQAVEAYVLYGDAGTSVRKVTAQILASVAQQAAVKAIFELAEGFAALALAFFGVPNAGPSASAHFAAAAIYGSIAGIAALAGRTVAGNAFKQNAGGSTGVTSTRSGSPISDRAIRESRQGGMSDPNQIIGRLAIDLKHPDGTMETQMVRIFKRNGEFRATTRQDLLGEATG